jgi:hypothetical protein
VSGDETRLAGTGPAFLRAAGLGAAATTGALVGFGVRRGAPAALLSAAGDRLRGLPAFVTPDRSLGPSAMLGLAHHLLLVVAWALLFVVVARPVRGPRRDVARGAIAALVAAVAVSADAVLPLWLCLTAGVASAPQRALLAIALSGALVIGMALAQRTD